MAENFITSQLDLTHALLAPGRTGVPLSEAAPERDPASLGALGGIGFRAQDPEIVTSVYFFEDTERHEEAIQKLTRDLPQDESLYTQHGTNGAMLFFGHARIDGPKGPQAKYRLGDIAAAFAGDEE